MKSKSVTKWSGKLPSSPILGYATKGQLTARPVAHGGKPPISRPKGHFPAHSNKGK